MLCFGTIGTGAIAATFAAGVKEGGIARIVAVYSRKPETGRVFAEKNAPGANIYDDLSAFMADPDIEAIYIASPNSLHFIQAKAALEAGKHVMCEKPATARPEQLYELQELASSRGLVFMEAMMSAHQPQLKLLKDAVSRCGTVREAHICYSQLTSRYKSLMEGILPNVLNPRMAGGALADLGVYCVNGAVELFGKPDKVSCRVVRLQCGADASGMALLEYHGRLVTLSWSKLGQGACPSEIIGDKGTVTIDMISLLKGIYFKEPKGEKEPVFGDTDQVRCFVNEISDFAEYINNPGAKDKLNAAQDQSRTAAQIMLALRRDAGIVFPEDEFYDR